MCAAVASIAPPLGIVGTSAGVAPAEPYAGERRGLREREPVVAQRRPSTVHPSRARTRSAMAIVVIQKRLFMGISGFVRIGR
jgi:hypothetical protein